MLSKRDLQAIQTLIKDEVDPLRESFEVQEKSIKSVKRKLNSVEKDLKSLIRRDDENDVFLQRRVTRLEEYLHLPPTK